VALFASARLTAIGLALGAMIIAVGANEVFAHTQRTKTKPVAKATQIAPEPTVKLRYYGGPKSPMYP
jgi:hypothetical protein